MISMNRNMIRLPNVAISQRTTPKDQLSKKKEHKEVITMYRFTAFKLFITVFIFSSFYLMDKRRMRVPKLSCIAFD